jgi:hypothetical protein
MPRGVYHFKDSGSDSYFITLIQQPVRRVGGLVRNTELRTERAATFQKIGISDMYGYLGAGLILYIMQRGYMVGMTVRQDDNFNIETEISDSPEDLFAIAAGVDYHAFRSGFLADDKAIGRE